MVTIRRGGHACGDPSSAFHFSFDPFSHFLLVNKPFLHVQTDFLIVVLRDVVQAYPEVRIVLMSATIDTSMFREYFFNCPIIEVFGRTFPVQGTALMSCDDGLSWATLVQSSVLF